MEIGLILTVLPYVATGLSLVTAVIKWKHAKLFKTIADCVIEGVNVAKENMDKEDDAYRALIEGLKSTVSNEKLQKEIDKILEEKNG